MGSLPERAFVKIRKDGVVPLFQRAIDISCRYIKRRYIDLKFIDDPVSRFDFANVDLELLTETSKQRGELNYLLFEEGDILRDIKSEIKEGDVFWDVGAHHGFYSVFVSKIKDDVDVCAFEPNESVRSVMKQNFELNDIEPEIFDCALADEDGEIELKATGDEGGRGAINADESLKGYDEYKKSYTVAKVRGDNLISDGRASIPDIVKIDVEGAEPLVVEGLWEYISNNQTRVLYIEVHKPSSVGQSIEDYGSSIKDFRDKLKNAGYVVEKLQESPGNMRIKAKVSED